MTHNQGDVMLPDATECSHYLAPDAACLMDYIDLFAEFTGVIFLQVSLESKAEHARGRKPEVNRTAGKQHQT